MRRLAVPDSGNSFPFAASVIKYQALMLFCKYAKSSFCKSSRDWHRPSTNFTEAWQIHNALEASHAFNECFSMCSTRPVGDIGFLRKQRVCRSLKTFSASSSKISNAVMKQILASGSLCHIALANSKPFIFGIRMSMIIRS
jgi:hypothetical protein